MRKTKFSLATLDQLLDEIANKHMQGQNPLTRQATISSLRQLILNKFTKGNFDEELGAKKRQNLRSTMSSNDIKAAILPMSARNRHKRRVE